MTHNEFSSPSPMYADIAASQGDTVTSHASYPPQMTAQKAQALGYPSPMEQQIKASKETSARDAFTSLENEIEDLHNTVEILYDALRNVLREPFPTGDESVDPRPGISDMQRALWDQAEKVRNERRALQLIIKRLDV